MAFSVVSKTDVWKVIQYSINPKDVVGNGAYGIVYKAKDKDGQVVAAKAINSSKHPGIQGQNLTRLLHFNHPNVVKILNIQQEEDKLWLFMEFCPLSDLNEFFQKNDLAMDKKLDIMIQMANGVSYLHDNKIIHRDIKPGNILVSCDSPLWVKLTDFDVSKFMNPDVETSVMSSNVGTMAFKAPEFFRRNEQGKITYHKNVDIFASGVTFLALLQSSKSNRNGLLVPQIETPRDDSEKFATIGSLLVERKKYNSGEMSIVKVNDTASEFQWDMATEIRKVVHNMTKFKPEDRSMAVEVVAGLMQILTTKDNFVRFARQQSLPLPKSTLCPTTPEFRPKGITSYSCMANSTPRLVSSVKGTLMQDSYGIGENIRQVQNAQDATERDIGLRDEAEKSTEKLEVREESVPLKRRSQSLQEYPFFREKSSELFRPEASRMSPLARPFVPSPQNMENTLTSGVRQLDSSKELDNPEANFQKLDLQDPFWSAGRVTITKVKEIRKNIHSMCMSATDDLIIRVQDNPEHFKIETKNKTMTSKCNHCTCRIIGAPNEPENVLECCMDCQQIKSYNLETEEILEYTRCVPYRVCEGPEESIFVMDTEYNITQFKFFKLKRNVYTNIKNAFGMCNVSHNDLLVVTSRSPGMIQGFTVREGTSAWTFAGNVDGRELTPRAVVADPFGRVFVSDNERVLVLEAAQGKLIQVLHPEDNEEITDICYLNSPIQLILLYSGFTASNKIVYYEVARQ